MSCDWGIKCITCPQAEEHYFGDETNHRSDLMLHMIKHAKAIGALNPFMVDTKYNEDVTFGLRYFSIRTAWFAKHCDHALVPINEYGQLLPDYDKEQESFLKEHEQFMKDNP